MGKNFFLSKPIIWLFLAISFLFLFSKPVIASDVRALKLAKYFFKHESPLGYLAPEFVMIADKYGLDYRLLPAISGVESTFGRNYLNGTFNVYGWGGGLLYFNSWSEGIEKVASGLKNNYVDKGAQSVEQIGYIYCPPNAVKWSYNVNYFMNEIEKEDVGDGLLPAPDEINLSLTI